MHDSVLFVAVSYYGSADAAGMISSLRGQTDKRWHLVIVDNSQNVSEAAALKTLADSDTRIDLVHSASNLGYFGGASAALKTFSLPYAWTVVCNVDLEFAPDVVEEALAMTDDAPDSSAVAAPSIISADSGNDQNPYMHKRPSPLTTRRRYWMFRWLWIARIVVVLSSLAFRLKRQQDNVHHPADTHIYAPHGACIFFAPQYFHQGGTLEHPVLLFGEEITVAEKCRELGLRISYEPRLRVTHWEHRSTGVWRSASTLRAQREATRYVRRLLL